MDSDNNLKAIFFQTPHMQQNFRLYPEFVMIDATYKLNNLRMPLFLLLIMDGNGQSEIVALWIVADEEKETIKQMLQVFKTQNKNHSRVTCVMADKDLTERAVVSAEFSNAHLLICLFHTMRSLKREISCEKLGITSGERNLALEIMQKLAYSASEEMYSQHYHELLNTNLNSVVTYYNENWHGIRDQWVEGLKNNHFNMMNRTNNRLECINQKIKSVVTKNSDLNTFWEDLMHCFNTLNTERDQKAVNVQLKTPIERDVDDTDIEKYMESLTPFAYNYIKQQYNLISKVKIQHIQGQIATVNSTKGKISTNISTCECSFFTVMQLPCRHIFALRKRLQLTLYDINICHIRWTNKFYLTGHRVMSSKPDITGNFTRINTTGKKASSAILSSHQKYREAFSVGQKIASCISELGMREYIPAMKELKTIQELLEKGKRFTIVEMMDQDGILCILK